MASPSGAHALFRRVRLAAADDHEALGEADVDNGFPAHKWRAALDEYYDVHEDVLVDADARSMAFLAIDESDEDSEPRMACAANLQRS